MSSSQPTLNKKQISHLRSLAHHLNPVVMIGNQGLTDNVIAEIDKSLSAHELVKIQVAGDEKSVRAEVYDAICNATGAQPVQHIGKQLVIFRSSEKQKISFPK